MVRIDILIKFVDFKLLEIWPNTYLFTKSVTKNIVKKHANWIPIGIFHPEMIYTREPIGRWFDNKFGSIEITACILMRLTRIHHCDQSVKVNFVSEDLATNELIVTT
ncbi:LOW QUALITY PROTEIN: fatty acyl-CoA reductase wat-like [Vespula maculifrons]|uniref:Fatty acyl-CoA reductase wat-like n=1 Tax=Vespula maculifrons TaxID=7453 RepID=A0ABD2CVM9_VESMC